MAGAKAEMSVSTQIVDAVRGPLADDAAAATLETTLEQVSLASHLLGGRPGARQLRRRQHLGQGHDGRPRRPRDPRDVGEGLGQRPGDDVRPRTSRRCASRRCCRCSSATRCPTRTWSRTWRAARSTRRRRAPRSRRCCTRSSPPRTSTTRILTRSTCSPVPKDGERLVAECFGDDGGVDPLHPPRLHARQAGRRGRARQPGAWGSSCSPSTASSSGATPPRRRTSAHRGGQPGGRVRQRQDRRASRRFDGPRSARRPSTATPDAARGAADAARRGLQRAPEGAARRHLAAAARVRLIRAAPG